MPRVALIELTDRERGGLNAILKKGSDWRERDRAETILFLPPGTASRPWRNGRIYAAKRYGFAAANG
jgi:hypothetical protein